VNLTDGLDGLATGACVMVFGAYTLVNIWQNNQSARDSRRHLLRGARPARPRRRRGRDHRRLLRLPVVERLAGAIFMGDTGSLSLGGALAGLAILTRTELLLLILGGLFVSRPSR
jgi:phospho-N-acetylmuramoyl-pentapeptide-transferase